MTAQVRSVTAAFAILRAVAARPRGMTLSDIARALDLSPSSALNLLRTLVAEGALDRSGENRRYRLVPGWSATALPRGRIERLIDRAQPAMRAFAEANDCTVGLWKIASPARATLVALGESEASTRIHMVIGQRQPLGGGSIGRAMAAWDGIDGPELARRHAAVRWENPLDLAGYAAQVEEARATGFGVDDGFSHRGVCSLGTMIPNQLDPRMCLTATTFAGSRDRDEIARLGRGLVALVSEPAFRD